MTEGSWRLRTYPLVVLAALAAVILLVVATSDDADSLSGRLGGDLPSVYGAGVIVAEGDASDLYDPARQVDAQAGLWAEESDTGVLFAYPPLVAAPYAALNSIGYAGTYLVHTAVMVLAVVASARLLSRRMPLLAGREWIPLGLAFSFTFVPMFIGVANGQNTALTLLAVVAVWVSLVDGRDGVAGAVAGFALVKPQYGVVLIGLLVLGRRWRAVAAAAAGAAVVWAGSALVAGPGWTGPWLELVSNMSDIDGGANLKNEVSWFGLAELVLGQGTTSATAVGGIAILATAGVLIISLRRLDLDDPLVPALVMTSLLLIAPHALYYDAGILVVALAVLLVTVPSHRRGLVAAGWWMAGMTHALLAGAGVEPVAALVIGTWMWALWAVHRGPASGESGNGCSLGEGVESVGS